MEYPLPPSLAVFDTFSKYMAYQIFSRSHDCMFAGNSHDRFGDYKIDSVILRGGKDGTAIRRNTFFLDANKHKICS